MQRSTQAPRPGFNKPLHPKTSNPPGGNSGLNGSTNSAINYKVELRKLAREAEQREKRNDYLATVPADALIASLARGNKEFNLTEAEIRKLLSPGNNYSVVDQPEGNLGANTLGSESVSDGKKLAESASLGNILMVSHTSDLVSQARRPDVVDAEFTEVDREPSIGEIHPLVAQCQNAADVYSEDCLGVLVSDSRKRNSIIAAIARYKDGSGNIEDVTEEFGIRKKIAKLYPRTESKDSFQKETVNHEKIKGQIDLAHGIMKAKDSVIIDSELKNKTDAEVQRMLEDWEQVVSAATLNSYTKDLIKYGLHLKDEELQDEEVQNVLVEKFNEYRQFIRSELDKKRKSVGQDNSANEVEVGVDVLSEYGPETAPLRQPAQPAQPVLQTSLSSRPKTWGERLSDWMAGGDRPDALFNRATRGSNERSAPRGDENLSTPERSSACKDMLKFLFTRGEKELQALEIYHDKDKKLGTKIAARWNSFPPGVKIAVGAVILGGLSAGIGMATGIASVGSIVTGAVPGSLVANVVTGGLVGSGMGTLMGGFTKFADARIQNVRNPDENRKISEWKAARCGAFWGMLTGAAGGAVGATVVTGMGELGTLISGWWNGGLKPMPLTGPINIPPDVYSPPGFRSGVLDQLPPENYDKPLDFPYESGNSNVVLDNRGEQVIQIKKLDSSQAVFDAFFDHNSGKYPAYQKLSPASKVQVLEYMQDHIRRFGSPALQNDFSKVFGGLSESSLRNLPDGFKFNGSDLSKILDQQVRIRGQAGSLLDLTIKRLIGLGKI